MAQTDVKHLPLSEKQRQVLEIFVSTGEYMQRKTCALFEDRYGERFPQPTFQKLVKRGPAKEYIEELQYRQGIRVTAVRNKVVETLSSLAFSNIEDIIDIKNGTVSVKDFEDLPREAKGCIKSLDAYRRRVSGTKDEYEDVLKVQLHDKKGALDSLTDLLNLKRRFGEELDEKDESNVFRFAGIQIIGPQPKKVIELDMPIAEVSHG